MDKVQKFEQSQKINSYLEDNQVFEKFLGLMKQLMVNKPDKPIDYLIDKLSNPTVKRVFILGPPGSERKEFAKRTKDKFPLVVIEAGSLLKKELTKKTDNAAAIQKAFENRVLVPDDVVIDILHKKIQEVEKDQQNWICEGFPRTKVQALSLQKLGVIPDKMINLSCTEEQSMNRIKQNQIEYDSSPTQIQLVNYAKNILLEYQLNAAEVKDVYKNFLFDIDTEDTDKQEVDNIIERMLKLKFSKKSSNRPPQVIIVGPPGSGRSTQARKCALQFGAIHVSINSLLKSKMKVDPVLAPIIQRCMVSGSMVPDELVNQLVEERLTQPDVQVNGFFMEGYPMNEVQFNRLKAIKCMPTTVFMFDHTEAASIYNLGNRRIDPVSGGEFNLSLVRLEDRHLIKPLSEAQDDPDKLTMLGFKNITPAVLQTLILNHPDANRLNSDILARLKKAQEDAPGVVKQRFAVWKSLAGQLEDLFADRLQVINVTDSSVTDTFNQLAKTVESSY